MARPATDTMPGLLRSFARRLTELERRPQVVVDPSAQEWQVLGDSPQAWGPFGATTQGPAAGPSASLSSAGIVSLGGLISNGTLSSGTAFTLPPEMWPEPGPGGSVVRYTFLALTSGDTAGRVYVYSDGRVVIPTSAPNSNAYISLAQVQYPAAGAVETWTRPLVFSNSWADYSDTDPTVPPVSYGQDAYGRVWLRGAVYRTTGGTVTTDQQVFSIPALADMVPAAYNGGTLALHFPASASSAAGFSPMMIQYSGTTTGIRANTGASTAFTSLSSLAFVPTSADSYELWRAPMYANGWRVYNTNANGGVSLYGFEDGFVMCEGMMASGTIAGGAQGISHYLPPHWQPGANPYDGSPITRTGTTGGIQVARNGANLYVINANLAVGRVTIQQTFTVEVPTSVAAVGALLTPQAAMVQTTGSTTWRSMNGINYQRAAQ